MPCRRGPRARGDRPVRPASSVWGPRRCDRSCVDGDLRQLVPPTDSSTRSPARCDPPAPGPRVDDVQQQSASRASCRVDRNAATSSCGRSRTNPTVSASATSRPARDAGDAPSVERGEELVGGVGVGRREPVEQRRLAGIRVADQRHRRHGSTLTLLAGGLALDQHLVETVVQRLDAPGEQAAVRLELGFAGSPQADAAFLALEVVSLAPGAWTCARAVRAPPAACLRRCVRAARRYRG